LYVYEAKMSLFIRIAQTRQGAERLLEARVLPVLADCDFLDTLPEVDQSFIGALLPVSCGYHHGP
jgi:nuclear pore complex protein Nup205